MMMSWSGDFTDTRGWNSSAFRYRSISISCKVHIDLGARCNLQARTELDEGNCSFLSQFGFHFSRAHYDAVQHLQLYVYRCAHQDP